MTTTTPQGQSLSWLVLLSMASIYIIWGSTYLAITYVIEDIPSLMAAAMRFVLAGIILFGIGILRGEALPSRQQWINAALLGTLMLGGGQGGVMFAEQWVASGLAAMMVATVPLWAIVFASFLERMPTRLEVIGLMLGMAGIIVLNLGADLWANTIGGLVITLSPIFWALGSMLSRQVSMPKGFMGVAAMLLPASGVMGILSVLHGDRLTHTPGTESIAGLLFLVIFGSVIAFSAYTYLLKTVTPAMATSYAYVNPIIALFLGWLVADETLSVQTLLASALIIAGVVIITTSRDKVRATPSLFNGNLARITRRFSPNKG